MKLMTVAIAVLALVACGNKATQQAENPGSSKKVDELAKRLDDMDGRLKKIETLLAGALEEEVEPDPEAVYAVSIDGDPFVGSEHAKVTLV